MRFGLGARPAFRLSSGFTRHRAVPCELSILRTRGGHGATAAPGFVARHVRSAEGGPTRALQKRRRGPVQALCWEIINSEVDVRGFWMVLAMSAALFAQVPGERVNNGFKALGTGAWSDAFQEWEKQSLPSSRLGPEARQTLEGWIPKTWSIGSWDLFQVVSISRIWQRQLWIASFDQGVVFFAFDFVLHKGEWRLFDLQVARDAKALAPNLDLYAAMTARAGE